MSRSEGRGSGEGKRLRSGSDGCVVFVLDGEAERCAVFEGAWYSDAVMSRSPVFSVDSSVVVPVRC